VNIILEKEHTFNPQGIVVLLDGHPTDYNIESREQSWILDFIYTHSIHNVIINLEADTLPPSEHQSEPEPFPTLATVAVVSLVWGVVVGGGLVVYYKKHKR